MSESQEERNRAEWHNDQNWHGPDWLAFYSSQHDGRTWVPKKIPWMGWTLNLGKRAGVMWLAVVIAFFLVVVLGTTFFVDRLCPWGMMGKLVMHLFPILS